MTDRSDRVAEPAGNGPAVTDVSFGAQLRHRRQQASLSLADMALRSGFSRSYLSQVERDLINPSLGAVKALADALDIPVANFFADPDVGHGAHRGVVLRDGERLRFAFGGSGVENEMLSGAPDGAIEFVLVRVAPGGSTGSEALRHAGEECAYVVRGELELSVGEETFAVSEGDSFCFPSTTPHSWRNPAAVEAVLVFAITPPSF